MLLIKGSLANSIDQNESCGTLPRRRVRTNQNIVLRVAAVEFPRSFEQLEEFADDRMFRLVRYNANHPRRRASEAQMNGKLNMSGTGSAILRKLPNKLRLRIKRNQRRSLIGSRRLDFSRLHLCAR
jgi:hypothetical protein